MFMAQLHGRSYQRLLAKTMDPSKLTDLSDITGLIASSQNLAYTISKFLGGIVSDSISSKVLFSSGLALAGIFTAAFTG